MKNILLTFLFTFLFIVNCSANEKELEENIIEPNKLTPLGTIILNPYDIAPLSASYVISNTNNYPITVTVKGLYNEPDIIHTYPANYGKEFEIHGLFPEATNTIIINDAGREIVENHYIKKIYHDDVYIDSKYTVEINKLTNDDGNNPELYFIQYFNGWYPTATIGISKNGYVRYFIKGVTASKIAIEGNKFLIYPMYEGKIYNMLGKELVKYPSNSHHDTIKKDDNYIYLSASKWGGDDEITEIDFYGNIVRKMSFASIIRDIVVPNNDKNEIRILNRIVFDENNIFIDENGEQKSIDWFHANSLVYDKETDILYISSRNLGVFAIDYSDWKLIWWFADETLNTRTGNAYGQIPYKDNLGDLPSLDAYRVKGDALTDGPKNQHALILLENGNLGMLDNQGDANRNSKGSRYVEYNITGEHGYYTAIKTDEFRDASLYSRITSDADIKGNNLLLTYGTIRTVLEVDKQTKEVLFKAKFDMPKSELYYRADKLPLYYEEGREYFEDANIKN
ncbi:aryl-sulfate sulfotransferase [Brachyspira pilosicoli]|uniref:aryl-sulfate sulfotransferase n=1 Tax=Brachyspira pilosicoli TaxID=52584 RepID=UPI0030044EC6